ncbi:MAG: phosphate/phosphite/phosphonate ABC transporter substrate-binding protein [Anaerolineae bacterium]
MIRKRILAAAVALLLFVACQPQLVLVEVTRVIEITPAGQPVPATPPPVEVTRLVVEEVTRVVPEEIIVEVTRPPLGTAERPVQLLFSPVADTAVIKERGEELADALAQATGLSFAVGIVDDEAALIELMCAAPVDTIGFLSAPGYVLAHEQCGVQPANVAIHDNGLAWQTGMLVVRWDSGIRSLEDLEGRRWAVADTASLTRFGAFQAMFAEDGVTIGEVVEVPGDSAAMLALYNREVDFATAAFVPPIMPYEERLWQYGEDSPEVWRRLGIAPTRSPIGYVLVMAEPVYGGYRLRDARSRIFDTTPGIFNETRILTLSGQMPNETVALSADFPLGQARAIIPALASFAASGACTVSLCSTDFFGWAGLLPADDAAYEPLRFVIESLGLSPEGLLALGP